MNSTALTVIGILIVILIFGIKTGLGCGFSTAGPRKIIAVAGSYFLLSVLVGSVMENFSMEYFVKISGIGLGVHVLLSLLLIGTGIYTQKKWNAGWDVSGHTFLVLSMPCPVCLAALTFCCMLLAASLELSGLKIGLLVGTAFCISALVSSFGFKRLCKTPESLGNVMLLLGIYYLLGAMIIPAYMKTKQLNLVGLSGDGAGVVPLSLSAMVILGGFLLGNVRSNQ